MTIKVCFKSGEVIEVTHELVALFLDGKTTPTESIAVLYAAISDQKTSFVLHMAQKNGIIPELLEDVTIQKCGKSTFLTVLKEELEGKEGF